MKTLPIIAAFSAFTALAITSGSAAEEIRPLFSFTLSQLPTKEQLPNFLKNLKEDTLPKIKTMHSCVQKTRAMTEEYLDVKNLLFSKDRHANPAVIEAPTDRPTGPSYDSNLLRNFNLIRTTQTKSLDAITTFNDSLKIDANADIAEVKTKLARINERVATLSVQLATSTIQENNFLYLLDTSIDQLGKMAERSESTIRYLMSDACNEVPVKDVAAFMAKDFDEMTKNVQEMRSYIVAAREKREILVNYLTQYHRYKLGVAYSSITGTELKKIQETLSGTLVVGDLVGEFSNWWGNVMSRGLGNYLDSNFAQYEEPLRVMKAREEIARGYLQRVDNIPGVLDAVKAEYKRQVSSKISILESSIKEHEARGWEFQARQQRIGVDFLLKSTLTYFDDCKQALTDYGVQPVTTLEAFRLAETRFFKIRTLCVTTRTVKP